MRQTKKMTRNQILARLMELAVGRANDAVKLAYLPSDQPEAVETLELGCLTELKRNANGTVEVKLVDRAAVLEKLLEQMREENAGPEAFLRALVQPENPSPEEKQG